MSAPRLWVFDFDWTVVNENSDTWIHRCAPGGSLPAHVADAYVPPDWTGYMNTVLAHLAGWGVTPRELRSELQGIPWTPGMRELLEAIRDSGGQSSGGQGAHKPEAFHGGAAAACGGGAAGAGGARASLPRLRGVNHAAILSDANSLFIPWILDASTSHNGSPQQIDDAGGSSSAGVRATDSSARNADTNSSAPPPPLLAEPPPQQPEPLLPPPPPPLSAMFLQILTNPAAADPATGALTVAPHHGTHAASAAPPHACPRCHPNLCKSAALRRLLDEQAAAGVSYGQVVYVGDGRNDACPVLGVLGPADVAMPRRGFALHKLLAPLAGGRSCNASGGGGAAAVGTAAAAAGAGVARGGGGALQGHEPEAAPSGDDHVYGAAAAAACTAAAGPAGDVLRAECVPWATAFEILEWAARREEEAMLAEQADRLALLA